jgi:hypothetical protein
MEKSLYSLRSFGVFYGHLEYFTVIWYILRPFGKFCDYLANFPQFGLFYQEKSGNPAPNVTNDEKAGFRQ